MNTKTMKKDFSSIGMALFCPVMPAIILAQAFLS